MSSTLDVAPAHRLRLAVVGQGVMRGRRPHLIRMREGLVAELKEVADGKLYMRIEIAVTRLIAELKSRPAGVGVIQTAELEPGPADEHLLDQRAAKVARDAKKKAAKT